MAHGVSGFEHQSAAGVMEEFMAPLVDEIQHDVLGNVIGVKRGDGPEPRPKVMLAGHMDEVGLLITKIEEGGFLRFITSGVDPRVLPGHEVTVHGKRSLTGLIGIMPPHISTQDPGKAYKPEDLLIDTGLLEDEVRELVRVGDVATYKRQVTELMGGLMSGKSLDDRAGVGVILVCLEELRKYTVGADVYGVATSQEESGTGGAGRAAHSIEPDIGIAIDVCQGDTPGVPEYRTTFVGRGPTITLGATIHPGINDALRKAAGEIGVNLQHKTAPSGTGTDAESIFRSRSGVPTGLISIPQRYMHTSVEVLSVKDVEDAGRVLAKFIASCDWEFVQSLKTWE